MLGTIWETIKVLFFGASSVVFVFIVVVFFIEFFVGESEEDKKAKEEKKKKWKEQDNLEIKERLKEKRISCISCQKKISIPLSKPNNLILRCQRCKAILKIVDSIDGKLHVQTPSLWQTFWFSFSEALNEETQDKKQEHKNKYKEEKTQNKEEGKQEHKEDTPPNLNTVEGCLKELGLNPNTSSKDILLKIRKQIREYHPDSFERDRLSEKFKKMANTEADAKILEENYKKMAHEETIKLYAIEKLLKKEGIIKSKERKTQ